MLRPTQDDCCQVGPITHIVPSVFGGVEAYVDRCMLKQPNSIKILLDEKSASKVELKGSCLLHYSGYGYSKRGAPLWLLNKIKQERANIKKLGIFFHELFATGAPWSSAFWLSPTQRMIAKQLVMVCDGWITNREDSGIWLRQFSADKSNYTIPIFSTVGEIAADCSPRSATIVIFGLPSAREHTYRKVGNELFIWAKKNDLVIHDIGDPILDKSILSNLKKNCVEMHGRLDSSRVSFLLSTASFGLLSYPVNYVAKSTIFAAYCAHGACPILISDDYSDSDGLKAGVHYIPGLVARSFSRTAICLAARTWYQLHDISAHILLQLNMFKEINSYDDGP